MVSQLKETKFKQNIAHGCPIFALANLLDYRFILDELKNHDEKKGINNYEENLIWTKHVAEHSDSKGTPFERTFWDVDISLPKGYHLGRDVFKDMLPFYQSFEYTETESDQFDVYIPFMVTISMKKNHRIACLQSFKNVDDIIVINSLKPNYERYTRRELCDNYLIFAYSSLMCLDHEQIIYFKKEALGHIFE